MLHGFSHGRESRGKHERRSFHGQMRVHSRLIRQRLARSELVDAGCDTREPDYNGEQVSSVPHAYQGDRLSDRRRRIVSGVKAAGGCKPVLQIPSLDQLSMV